MVESQDTFGVCISTEGSPQSIHYPYKNSEPDWKVAEGATLFIEDDGLTTTCGRWFGFIAISVIHVFQTGSKPSWCSRNSVRVTNPDWSWTVYGLTEATLLLGLISQSSNKSLTCIIFITSGFRRIQMTSCSSICLWIAQSSLLCY